jgi:tetratricopeptide (TPR) repeat protein
MSGRFLITVALVFAAHTLAAQEGRSVRALLQQSRAQAGAGKPAAALELLRQARELAPNSEEVLGSYAQVALAARLPVQAIDVLEALTRVCPGVAQYRYLLGVGYLQVGEMEQAVSALREADRLERNQITTLVALGLALNGRKLYSEAEPFLRRALTSDPENADALAALAETEEAVGDTVQAEAHASRALAAVPEHAGAHFVIGLVRMNQQRYADARDALLRAIAAQPDMARAHYQVSLAYSRLGDEANAARHLAIYQQKVREMEASLKKVRGQ